jgi:predicted dehydrogenase
LGWGEGRSIVSAALSSPHWRLINVCDVNEELCKARAAEFGLPSYTLRYDDLLVDDRIDTIAIYTPDQLHGEHIVAALEAGKNVICTKPLLASIDEAGPVIRAARNSTGKVFVGQSSRFFEPMIHQRRDFETGRLGVMDAVESYYITDGRWFLDRPWSRAAWFSWMYGFLIHAVDLVRWYMPDIVEVFGMGRAGKNTEDAGITAPDTLRFLLRDREGRIGTVAGSYTSPTLGRAVEPSIGCTIRGSDGASRAVYPVLEYHTRFSGEEPTTHEFPEKHGYYFRFEDESHHAGEYQNYLDYFAGCLDRGVTAVPDLDEGLHTLALMQALEESIGSGLPVSIRDQSFTGS